MQSTFYAVYLALIVSPFLGMIVLIPYLIKTYEKNKTIYVKESLYFYLLAISVWGAWFMTMLPFPTRQDVMELTKPYLQPIPFNFIIDYFRHSGVAVSDLATVLPSLKTIVFLGPAFNIVMLMPVGFFLREIYNTSLKKTTLIGFLISLFFEIVQLSALFFIYPRPYRMFDVDDLMFNTLGAFLGWVLVPLINKIPFMSINRINRKLHGGGGVSMRRRLPAIIIDKVMCLILPGAVLVLFKTDLGDIVQAVMLFILYMLANVLQGGVLVIKNRTPGMALLGLRTFNLDKGRMKLWQAVVYECIQGMYFLLPFVGAYLLFSTRGKGLLIQLILVSLNVVVLLIYLQVCFEFFINSVTHESRLFYDKACHLYLGINHKHVFYKKQDTLVFDVLKPEVVEGFSDKVFDYLMKQGYQRNSALKIRLMVEGVLDDWLMMGLAGQSCTLRFDRRPWCRTIVLIIVCNEKQYSRKIEGGGTVEAVSGLKLAYDSYCEEYSRVYLIDVP